MSQTDLVERAAALHRQAIVIDGHSDILIPVADGKMRLSERTRVPDPATWQPPPGLGGGPGAAFGFPQHALFYGPMGQYDIPRWQEGGVTAQICAIYIEESQMDWALKRGLEMAWCLREAAGRSGLELVTSVDDIHRLKGDGGTGAILGFEGFEALGADLRFLDLYYALGLRVASLTHVRRNIYADGCWAADRVGGLTDLGKRAIQRMNELGVVIDLVHIGEPGLWEILSLSTAPVILSHSTSTMFPSTDPADRGPLGDVVPRPRLELPRDRPVLEALAANGGVLGIIWFYQADLDDVVRDIETALAVMGPDHVGLGSDLYGLELAPRSLESIDRLPDLTHRLLERGHDEMTIRQILGGNYLRVFAQAWR